MSSQRLKSPGVSANEQAELGANVDVLGLYRRLSDEQPSADLDARILAMAAAAEPAVASPAGRQRRRMPAWMTLAASTAVVLLGTSLAWRLQMEQPLPQQRAIEAARESAAAGDMPVAAAPVPHPIGAEAGSADGRAVQAKETIRPQLPVVAGRSMEPAAPENRAQPAATGILAAPASEAPMEESVVAPERAAPTAARPTDTPVGNVAVSAPKPVARAPGNTTPSVAPPSVPVASGPPRASTPAVAPLPEPVVVVAPAADDGLMAAPPPADPAPAPATEAERDRLATLGGAPASGQSTPKQLPGASRSPLDREAWLESILALLDADHVEEARVSLAEWRRRFPRAEVPERLRPLLATDDPAYPAADRR